MNRDRLVKTAFGLGLLVAVWGVNARAQVVPPSKLTSIKFDQKLEQTIDLSLPFVDENGRPVKLGDYFGTKPVILDLGYYECPMLCSLVLNGLIESLQSVDGSVGKDFTVVCVSISPTERPKLAAAKKRNYVRVYGRPGAATGWHFLTGQDPAIRKLADQVGFEYVYDPQVKQYAHPSGLVILSPQGKVSKYLFGVSYAPSVLNQGLKDAGREITGSPVRQLLLLCCSFLPLTGKHSGTVMVWVRILGVVVVLALAAYITKGFLQEGQRASAPEKAEAGAEKT